MLHLTAKNFQIEVKDTSLPVIVMFYAIWCGKCAMMKPVVEDIEKKYAGKIKFSVMGGMVDEHTFESRMLEILS